MRVYSGFALHRAGYYVCELAAIMDYKTENLKIDDKAVDSFKVVCFLAEDALVSMLDVGHRALAEKDLPTTLLLSLDGYRGQRQVKTYVEDREMAVSIAKRVRSDCHAHGLELRRAKVEVASERGRRRSDHDMVLEIVNKRDGKTMCDAATPEGFLSGELRCRRLRAESGFNTFRTESHKECDAELQWWQDLVKNDKKREWCGRAIVLCNYRPATGEFETRCDIRLVHDGAEFKGLWGWYDSGDIMRPEATKHSTRNATVQAEPKSSAVPKQHFIRPKPNFPTAPSRPTWEQVNARLGPWYRKITPQGLWTWHQRECPVNQRKPTKRSVAPVPKMFEFMNKTDLKHVGEKIKPLKRRYDWDDDDCFKAPRMDGDTATSSRKKGASEEWVATEKVLEQIYNNCKDR